MVWIYGYVLLWRDKLLYVYPNQYVHLTNKNLGRQVRLRPGKSYTPVGVSFAPNIKRALNALPVFYTGEDNFAGHKLPGTYWEHKYVFFIYTPLRMHKAVVPVTADDTKESGERRVLGPVMARRIGKIVVTTNESQRGRKIHTMRYSKVL